VEHSQAAPQPAAPQHAAAPPPHPAQQQAGFRLLPGGAPASAGRHRLAHGTQGDHSWFAATACSQHQQPPHGASQHERQPPPRPPPGQLHLALLQQAAAAPPLSQQALSQPPLPLSQQQHHAGAPPECGAGGGSQQSLSLAHFFRPSQHQSDARGSGGAGSSPLVGSLGDGMGPGCGSALVEETVDQPPVSPPRLGGGGSPRDMDAPGGDAAMCTPATGWGARGAGAAEDAADSDEEERHLSQLHLSQQYPSQQHHHHHPQQHASQRPPPEEGQQQHEQGGGPSGASEPGAPPSSDPCMRCHWGGGAGPSPQEGATAWRRRPLEVLTGDSGSRAGPSPGGGVPPSGSCGARTPPSGGWPGGRGSSGSGGGACTPLSEGDFVLKASQSYTRAMAVASPVLPGGGAFAGAFGSLCCGGCGGVAAQPDYHTPVHAGSEVRGAGSPCGGVGGGRCLQLGQNFRSLFQGHPVAAAPSLTPRPSLRCCSQDQPSSSRGGAGGSLSLAAPGGLASEPAAVTLTAEETTTPELECLGAASQEPPHSARGGGGAGGVQGGGGGGHGGGASVCEQEATTAQALFPIFRPRNQRKCIVLVRHGESSECARARPIAGGGGGGPGALRDRRRRPGLSACAGTAGVVSLACASACSRHHPPPPCPLPPPASLQPARPRVQGLVRPTRLRRAADAARPQPGRGAARAACTHGRQARGAPGGGGAGDGVCRARFLTCTQ
jgi:hypothetical protein